MSSKQTLPAQSPVTTATPAPTPTTGGGSNSLAASQLPAPAGEGGIMSGWQKTSLGLGSSDLPGLLSEQAQTGIEWNRTDPKANQVHLTTRSWLHWFGGDKPGFKVDSVKLASVKRPELETGAVEGTNLTGSVEPAGGKDSEDTRTNLAVDSLAGKSVRMPQAKVQADHVDIHGITLAITSRGKGGTDVQFTADSANLDGLTGAGVHADHVSLAKTTAGVEGGDVHAGIGTIDAKNVRGGGATAAGVHATGASLTSGANGLDASVAKVGATGVQAGGATARTVDGKGLGLHMPTTGKTQVGAEQIGATAVAVGDQKNGGSAGAVTATGVKASTGGKGALGLDVSADEVSGQDLSGRATLAGGGSGLDPALTKQILSLVQDLHLHDVKLPLGAAGKKTTLEVGGHEGTIDPGTVATLEVGIEGGKVVPKQTKASIHPGISFLHLTRLQGVYLTDDGKVHIDLSLLPNFDVTHDVKSALGIADSSALALNRIDPGKLAGGGSGGGSDLVRFGEASGHGDLRLGGGTLSSGDSSVTLADGKKKGDNSGDVELRPGKELALTFTRLVAGMFRTKVAGGEVKGGETTATGASVDLDLGGKATKVSGEVKSVTSKGVKGSL